MNKKEYIDKLTNELSSMSYGDVREIVAEIEEHFEEGRAAGKTEQEIAEGLGDVKELADGYLSGTKPALTVYRAQQTEEPKKKGPDVAGVLFVIFFNLLVFIPVWLSVLGIIVSIYGVMLGLLILAIWLCIMIPTIHAFTATIILFTLTTICADTCAFCIMFYPVKWFFIGTKEYCKWNKKLWNEGF